MQTTRIADQHAAGDRIGKQFAEVVLLARLTAGQRNGVDLVARVDRRAAGRAGAVQAVEIAGRLRDFDNFPDARVQARYRIGTVGAW